MAMGFIFMPLLTVPSLEILARFAQPLVILGQIFLYVGIIRFLDKERDIDGYLIFLFLLLLYFLIIIICMSIMIFLARTVVVTASLAAISLMTAYNLFFNKDRLIFSLSKLYRRYFPLIWMFFSSTYFF